MENEVSPKTYAQVVKGNNEVSKEVNWEKEGATPMVALNRNNPD